ncbi:unnamed protein product [Paramecium sonneborni]|uniref:MACPF domain-containing protein n=1 Tax=Paramecium sonneborni TaxID=65129 RepID=A0A8S1L3Y0_9CILI|nr:unnamed protein product [Paramecium sonneborni]
MLLFQQEDSQNIRSLLDSKKYILEFRQQKQAISDGKHKIRDNLNVITKKGCKYNFESFIIKNTEQIQNYMSSFVGVNLVSNIDITLWAFTKSSEFNHMQQKIEQNSVTFVISIAACQIAQITQVPELAEFNQSFIDQLSTLPIEYSVPQYLEFLFNFETHYTTDKVLGSRVDYVYTFPPGIVDDFDQKKSQEIDLKKASIITFALLKRVISLADIANRRGSQGLYQEKLNQNLILLNILQKAQVNQYQQEKDKFHHSKIDYQKTGQNLKQIIKLATQKNLNRLCKLLQLQGQRNGKCETNKSEIGQWVESKKVCLNFLKDFDWRGPCTQKCSFYKFKSKMHKNA